ncbi:FISUMP domain-containing protein [Fibrobacter sp. UBA3718]|uniref:FISUMP domain-containing protein n=1 Tax=Fibrobacter sp. UBA3718 TaxID=1946531 RepID=UPI0025B90E4A|nr:FISUMP domain-containing protein [Fibrobacter sp. UBA3718]
MKKSFQRVIATLNLFQGKQSLTIFMLAAFFALSACDDSSSASSDETGVSSSSVESSDSEESSSSVDKKSSGNETKDKSSSSDTKSSSSTKESKVSSDSKSSSSVKSDDSSSSKKDTSSSSENSSSSKNQSSSSSVKQSSSSSNVTQSSSSIVKGEYFNPSLSYSEFEDDRDHRVYKYLTITGKNQSGETASVTVMAENLNVGEMIEGKLNQSNESKIEKYCYNNDTAICLTYGGLYQWAEMMQLPSRCNTESCADSIHENHQGICPKGWRLLTYDDFYIVAHADKNKNGVSDVRATFFGGLNYSGYTLIGAGYNWNYEFRNKDESAYWHYPEEGRSNDNNIASFVGLQTRSSKSNSTQDTYKTHGFSVRCVKVD